MTTAIRPVAGADPTGGEGAVRAIVERRRPTGGPEGRHAGPPHPDAGSPVAGHRRSAAGDGAVVARSRAGRPGLGRCDRPPDRLHGHPQPRRRNGGGPAAATAVRARQGRRSRMEARRAPPVIDAQRRYPRAGAGAVDDRATPHDPHHGPQWRLVQPFGGGAG